MKIAKTFLMLIVMLISCSLVAFGQVERNPYREAYETKVPSVARADLLACRELSNAKVSNPHDLDINEFKRMLTGTWVRQLTWNGISVENNSALFFDFRGSEPVAMMYDQSNLGGGPMFNKMEEIRRNPKLLTGTPRLTFVDCDYEIVDTYYKISDDLIFDGLPVTAATTKRGAQASPLLGVWKELISKRFFRYERTESAMASEPGAEMLSPSVGGALWNANMDQTQVGRYKGATLRLKGDYRGAHVSEVGRGANAKFEGEEDVRFEGTETAQFFMDGNKYVASTQRPQSQLGVTNRRAGDVALRTGGWSTDCGSFFNLPDPIIWERVVLDPGTRSGIGATSPSQKSKVDSVRAKVR